MILWMTNCYLPLRLIGLWHDEDGTEKQALWWTGSGQVRLRHWGWQKIIGSLLSPENDFWWPRGCLKIKMSSSQYRDSHVKEKTVSPTVLSLTWESPCLRKMDFILKRGSERHYNKKSACRYRDPQYKIQQFWESYVNGNSYTANTSLYMYWKLSPVNERSQAISSHDIDYDLVVYSDLSSWKS